MPILAFHEIEGGLKPGITHYPPDRFEHLLGHLQSAGYRFYSMKEYIEVTEADGNIALTFDDGYKSLLDRAVPALQARRLPFSIFMPAGFTGKTNRWDYTHLFTKKEHLSADDLRQLWSAGAEIGCHGLTHVCLTDLSDRLLKIELERSKKELEDIIGGEVPFISYPFGRYNDKVEVFSIDAGYSRGLSLSYHRRSRIGFTIPRAAIYCFDTPYSVTAKIKSGPLRPLERAKGSIVNAFSYGTILYNRLTPRNWQSSS